MRWSIVTLALPALVAADFSIWSMSCDNGLGFGGGAMSITNLVKDGADVCAGCNAGTEGGKLIGGNPCNGECGDNLHLDTSTMDLVADASGLSVGHCENGGDAQNQVCNYGAETCSAYEQYRCITAYCV